ncbi:MAG: DUF167 domain-containing protein [SAR202 cluster bacterium]|nr:DUF167 domain-containing protein [SAR202 cluster bacterium]
MARTMEVRVQPRAGRNAVEVDASGRMKVYVTAPPEGGKANAAVIALVAEHLGVPKSSISIVRGHTSRNKVLRVEG